MSTLSFTIQIPTLRIKEFPNNSKFRPSLQAKLSPAEQGHLDDFMFIFAPVPKVYSHWPCTYACTNSCNMPLQGTYEV